VSGPRRARPLVVAARAFPGDTRPLRAMATLRIAHGSLRPRILSGADTDAAGIWTFGEAIDDALLDALPALRVVANHGVGLDLIDRTALDGRGVALVWPAGVNADAVADHAFGLLIALRHRIVAADRMIRAGAWPVRVGPEPLSEDVFGSTLGIIGLGAIGEAVARRAAAFRMRVVYHSPTRKPRLESELGLRYASLRTLLGAVDAVTLHCPLTPRTRGLIDADALRRMKRGAVLINAARGAIVDQDALIRALDAGGIAGAALDVFADEPHVPESLRACDRVVLTPHVADWTRGTNRAMTATIVTGLLHHLRGA
jgi:glyoxylate reductase